MAIEDWFWATDLAGLVHVHTEVRPSDRGIDQALRKAVDILVEARTPKGQWALWIELKERGTWWLGGPAKAFGTANGGIESDLRKWDGTTWRDEDIVVACQVLAHDGSKSEQLPINWLEHLDRLETRAPLFVEPAIVGDRMEQESAIRWIRMDFFEIHC